MKKIAIATATGGIWNFASAARPADGRKRV